MSESTLLSARLERCIQALTYQTMRPIDVVADLVSVLAGLRMVERGRVEDARAVKPMPEPTTLREQEPPFDLAHKMQRIALDTAWQKYGHDAEHRERLTQWLREHGVAIWRLVLANLGLAEDARAATSGWQPIASAPKDGRHVLGYFPAAGRRHAAMIQDINWDGDNDWAYYGPWKQKPTHWMPLPAPPDGAPQDGEL